MNIPQSSVRKAQLISESTAAEMVIDSYVVHRSTQSCKTCLSVECYSTIFEVWVHPTKTRTTGVRSLKLSVGELKNLPIAIVDLPERAVPTCYDCVETYAPHGSTPIPPASRLAWEETLKRKYAAPEPARSAPRESHIPTLESL